MLSAKQDLTKILFLDLETTSLTDSFFDLSPKLQELFKIRYKMEIDKKIEDFYDKVAWSKTYTEEEILSSDSGKEYLEKFWSDKAPFSPEFGKIVSIASGGFTSLDGDYTFRSKNLSGDNEVEMLKEFSEKLKKITKKHGDYEFYLCAHNGKEFDFPFLAKRIIINRLELPELLDYTHLKPWEISYLIDTKDTWKYGVFNGIFSLDIICASLGVESSKGDMHGSKVKEVFYKDKDYKRIGDYCEADVMALATCYLRMKGIYNNVIKV